MTMLVLRRGKALEKHWKSMGPSPCPCRRSDGSLRASIAAELQGGLGKPGSTAGCAWKEAVPENSEQCDAQHFRGDFQGSG